MESMDKSQILSRLDDTTYKVDTKAQDLEIEVGDSKQPEFEPRMKLMKWDNEVNFSVGVVKDPLSISTFRNEEEKIIWEQEDKEAHFYPVEEGYEFEVLLKEKPVNNTLEFSIETKGLDFFYQPFLTEGEKLAKEVIRPSNVEGSYAVYYGEKQGDYSKLGGKDYQTGKAFHIYRPKIIDANGKWAWGILNIDTENKLLTIKIPSSILEDGLYPLVVDPTFGYTTAGASEAGLDNSIWGSKFSPSTSGSATSITAYIHSYDTGDTYNLGIYNTSESKLGDCTATSHSGDVTNWRTRNLDSGVSVIASTTYFLVIGVEGTSKRTHYLKYDSGTSGQSSEWAVATGADDMPSSLTSYTETAGDKKYSIYATYTEAASSGTNMQINIGDTWKTVTALKINVGDSWKPVTKVQINVGDTWKPVF